MADLMSILNDPNYVNANTATKRAIFDKFSAQDANYAEANEATQAAIRKRFGLEPELSSDQLTVAEAIPFVSPETRAQIGQTIREARAGAAQAIMAPAQLLPEFVTEKAGIPKKGADTEAYLAEKFGIDPTTIAAKTGQIGTEMALGAPIIKGTGALVGRAAPGLGQAIRTGGFEIPADVTGAKSIGLRMAGGGIAGAASAAPFNPQDVMFGGPLGAILAPAGRLALGAARTAKGLFTPPEQVAENALLSAGGEQTINALRATQGMRATPGYVPSVAERAVEGGVDNLALSTLQERIKRSTQAAQIQFDSIQKNMGYLQGQLDRIDQDLAQQGAALAPAEATRLSEIRNSLQRQIAGEERNLNALMASLKGTLPPKEAAAPGQAPGEILQTRAESLKQTARTQEVQPAYDAAFKAAGTVGIDVTPLAAAARNALGKPLAEFAPESMPAVARVLSQLEAEPVRQTFISSGGRPRSVVTGEAPPTMTLKELDALRKAINSDIASAQRSQAGLTSSQLPDLYALHKQIDEAVRNAPNLPTEAKDLYSKALETYRTRFAPAFKDNVTGRLLKDSAFGETRVLPENAVAAYMKDPLDTQQFISTFGSDPQARAALTQGVQGMFRDAVVDAATLRIKPDAAAKFLQDKAEQLQILERNGIPIRQQLERVQTEAARLTQGLDEIGALRGVYGRDNPQAVVEGLLKSPTQMNDALKRMSPEAKDALQASITQRVTNMISGADANVGQAVKFLADNSYSVKQAMGAGAFDDLKNLVERAGEVRKVSKELQASLPDVRVQPKIEKLTGTFTRDELTDLSSVAADIARFRRAEGLGAVGEAAARPAAQRLQTETVEQTSPIQGYNPLNKVTSLALRISRNLEKRIDDKAATELAVLMYRNPDEALAAMQRAAGRNQQRTMFSGAVGRATATGGVQAGTAVAKPFTENMLAPAESDNALAR